MLALLLLLSLFLLLLNLPEVPPRGRLIHYFALPRSPPREAVTERPALREAGTFSFGCGVGVGPLVVALLVVLPRGQPRAGLGVCVSQKSATRGSCPETRHAGDWDFRLWLWLGLRWWRCGAGGGGRGGGGRGKRNRIAKGGRLGLDVAQRPATREAGTLSYREARHAGGWGLTLPTCPPRARLGL